MQDYREAVVLNSQGSPRSGAPLVHFVPTKCTPKAFHN